VEAPPAFFIFGARQPALKFSFDVLQCGAGDFFCGAGDWDAGDIG